MIRIGTVQEWWRVSMRYPIVRHGPRSFLKKVGYAFVLDEIDRLAGPHARILEFGHGFDTTIPTELGYRYEIHSLDDYQALPYFLSKEDWDAQQHQYVADYPSCRIHRGLLGGRKNDLPDGHFDIVCSVSVLEELSASALADVIADARRVLKPGGYFINSFDFFEGRPAILNSYLKLEREAGFDLGVSSGRVDLFRLDAAREDQLTVILHYDGGVPETQRTWSGDWHTLLTTVTNVAAETTRARRGAPKVTVSPSLTFALRQRAHDRVTPTAMAIRRRLGRIRRRWINPLRRSG